MASRRLGLTAALTVGPIAAWRFAQAYRARAGYPHRHPPEYDPGDIGLAFDEVRIPSGGVDLPAWWIPAASRRAGPGGPARPRLGVGPRPDAPERARAPRRGVPRADDRGPRTRREPAGGAAADRRRVRCRRHGGRPLSPRARGRHEGRDPRAFDGRHRRAPGRSGGAAGRRGRRRVDAGGRVPAHAPDVPPRPPAAARPVRVSARLAHDARLPRAARPHRSIRLRGARRRDVSRPDPPDPRRRGPGRAGEPPLAPGARGRQGSRGRPRGGAGRDADHPRRPAQLAVRVRRLSRDRRPVPRPSGRRAARPGRRRGRRARDAGVTAPAAGARRSRR